MKSTKEFRTSLTNGKLSDDEIREKLHEIEEQAEQMTIVNVFMLNSINRVMDISKLKKGGHLAPKMETMKLIETLDLPIKCMQGSQSKVKIQLNPIDSDICSHIITDQQWFQENIFCYLSNAVKYSHKGEVSISVSKVSASDLPGSDYRQTNDDSDEALVTSTESMLLVEVQDTGIGISKSVMDDLFSPFKQAQGFAGGTGLGLFSLANRSKALGGSYGVQDRSDGKQGSNFWFSIPYKADMMTSNHMLLEESKDNDESDLVSTYTSITDSTKSFNILLVDDSEFVLKVTGKFLLNHGHQVTTALNGDGALKILDDARKDQTNVRRFDMVVMDLHMPVMDGT